MLVLSSEDVGRLLTFGDTLACLEWAYAALGKGRAEGPRSDLFSIPEDDQVLAPSRPVGTAFPGREPGRLGFLAFVTCLTT